MGLTEYEKYIRTEELLALQKAPEALTCHDEMQFQIVHQAAELWMKLCAFELHATARHIHDDHIARAMSGLVRVNRAQRLLAAQMELLDTMSPKAYMTVRTGLGQGSGQESPGFKTMLRLPGEIMWPALAGLLERRSLTLRAIYEEPEAHQDVYALCERYVDYDQNLQAWRYRHLLLVYRIIGLGTPSLKGKASELLAKGMKLRFFPKLWEVRDELFAEWTKSMLGAGKDVGYHG